MMCDIIYAIAVGLIVGVGSSLTIVYIKYKKIDPENWKKDVTWQSQTQKLEIYGQLKTLLDTGRQRIKRQDLNNKNDKQTHLLMIPEDYETLKNIFGKYRYILSENLVKVYLEFIQKDKYFSDVFSKENKIDGNVNSFDNKNFNINLNSKQTDTVLCNLEDLEKTVTSEYDALKRKYNKVIN